MSDKCLRVWLHRLFLYSLLIVLLILVSYCQCCGPGRSGGRRRSPRKLTPLVYKQHVPNVAENTLGASGLTEGRISREDPRFSDLVPNYNVDILFTDEEGTGADRLMTERCKEKLNTLAVSVMNQWPGVRLRVVEAWDEGSHHVPNSLHYEGRAVDVATSDKDLTKHGMLARLAVQAGFDWVYYESRSRIHCSVKSESTSRKNLGGCFPGKAAVQTPSGRMNLENLQEGDVVKVLRPDGKLIFSPILMFLHKDHNVERHFISLVTSSGVSVNLTPSHLVFVLRNYEASDSPTIQEAFNFGETLLAGQVTMGNYLIVTHNDSIYLEKVVNMNSFREKGVFAPLTAEGNVIVDNVVASCYAVIDSHRLAHWAFLPFRLYIKFREAIFELMKYIELDSSGTSNSVKRFHPKHDLIEKANVNNLLNISKYASINYLNQKKSVISKPEIIHWYPRMLYAIAAWILPSHMVNM